MKTKSLILIISLLLSALLITACTTNEALDEQNSSQVSSEASIESESVPSEEISQEISEDAGEEASEGTEDANIIICKSDVYEYKIDTATGYGIYKTTYKIDGETLLLADGRTLPMHYSEYSFNEESNAYETIINGRKYRLNEYTDEEGRLCQMLYDCEENCEKPDHTTLCYFPELEYGEIQLAFEIESVENDSYTLKYNDGYTEIVSIIYNEELGAYIIAE